MLELEGEWRLMAFLLRPARGFNLAMCCSACAAAVCIGVGTRPPRYMVRSVLRM